jgi:Calcineurin-like phosphoesterase
MTRLVSHLFRVLKALHGRHPVNFLLFYLCLLCLIGVEVWFNSTSLPTQHWIAENLRKIRAEGSNDFSFAVFGDNKNSHSIFPELLRKVDQDHDIKFALDMGDLVFDGEMEKYRYFINQVRDNIKKPFLTAIGNHEIGERGRGLYYDLFGPFYYSFQIGGTYFIVLDDADEIGLDPWQQAWLEKALKKSQGYTTRFVFMHVPLFDPRGWGYHHGLPETEARSLLKLFKQNNVSHLFASHIHGYYEGQWEGIPYTITGGAGAELAGKDPKHDFFNYIKVGVKGNTVDVTVQPIPSPDYEWLDRFGYNVWLYVFPFFRFHGVQLALFLLMAYLLGAALRKKQR